MEKVIVIVLSLFSLHIHSQTQTIKPIENIRQDSFIEVSNIYYKDVNNRLGALVGTWEYNNGVDYFKITFTLVKKLTNENYNIYQDELDSKFIYKKNNVAKYDNYGNMYSAGSNVNIKPSTIMTGFVLPSKVTFIYSEPSATTCYRKNIGDLDIQVMAGNPTKLVWKRTTETRYFRTGPCEDGSEVDPTPFIIPADMILTKIN